MLDALARRDETALRALALNDAEFRAHVWPALPAARPERNLPFSFVWGDLRQKSDAFLRGTLAAHGGRRYALIRLTFARSPTEYTGFRVHGDPVVDVRDHDGAVKPLRLSGSFIDINGEWKVFSYVTGD